ncbi:uncharacterized protein RJT20DRAFT_130761 [Scheffersomyces xylosifermentans]|uniref:uncharacterized protein n=1 Tax=Scheffersomyces xylosifermentans TaxID=1304137 RepID=UPI00315E02A0
MNMLRSIGSAGIVRRTQLDLIRCYATRERSSTVGRYQSEKSKLPEVKKNSTNLQAKLNYFIETGQVLRKAPSEYERKAQKTRQSSSRASHNYSLQKALLILKSKYDTAIFQTENGSTINIHQLKPQDLKPDSDKALLIFKNIVHMKKVTKVSPDKKLVFTLLGTNDLQLKDPFLVTSDILKLLERDNDIERALYLVRLVKPEDAVVGMNAILQWLLERGDVKGAMKNHNDRKRWGIPSNSQTYIIFFDGIAKSHKWGGVSDEMCENIKGIFDRYRQQYSKHDSDIIVEKDPKSKREVIDNRCSIEHFNACLSLLIKNFKNDQEQAWAFFDTIIPDPKSTLPVLVPDIQTFTILLDGVKRYTNHKSTLIHENKQMPNIEKTLRLLEAQGTLVSTAELILEKVLHAATPPVPPTKEEADANPTLLIDYRAKARRQLVNIDPAFVSVFVSCFISSNLGTGADIKSGSHYAYVQRGLEYLKFWCPEVEEVFTYMSEIELDGNASSVNKNLKYHTDSRIREVIKQFEEQNIFLNSLEEGASASDILPENIISSSLERSKVNPNVIFPPPPSSKNKTRAIFSGKDKPLVDFTRIPISDMKLLELHKAYKSSRGKFGKKLSDEAKAHIERKRPGVNRFLLAQALEGLIKLGRKEEFVVAVWYALTKWGGINISSDSIASIKKNGIQKGVLSTSDFARFYPSNDGEAAKREAKTSQKHNEEIVDIMLIENFIFKLNEHFKQKGTSASNVIVEIFSSLVSPYCNATYSLRPRMKTADVIFSSLIKDLHYFNDSNYNKSVIEKKEQQISNNTPKKSISGQQLGSYLVNLSHFMDALLVMESRSTSHSQNNYLLPNLYVDSYNKIIERIYNSTWIDSTEAEKLEFHKEIIHSGILIYSPKNLIDSRKNLSYSTPILKSMEYVYNELKEKQGLSRQDVILVTNLKRIFQLQSDDSTATSKLRTIAKKIYTCLQPDKAADKVVETTEKSGEETFDSTETSPESTTESPVSEKSV